MVIRMLVALVIGNLGYLVYTDKGIAACPIPFGKETVLLILVATALVLTVALRLPGKAGKGLRKVSLIALWTELSILASNFYKGQKLPIPAGYEKPVGILVMLIAGIEIVSVFAKALRRRR